ncbi:hypothetical protein PFAG_00630 [Plasmodium falciparum Santa Lucia]|uniref:Protein phosphatase 1 regulatory subunit 21 N-terminal domain-containing protein n=1 Tax=Plasmodium falciparum Santa Lucia TaxID=478859 RepID=W7G109_PLAFA|nr:hypothetical protein PFAG_00630 [Plasmodium falciparum Santa Lucia]
MNVEDRYKLIKEKYKEIKEQNDILKKAIIEYKKDLKELEKKNDILSNDKNQLQKNLTQLTNSLEEQKKKNSGWTNLMLLTKNSRENIHKSVAFEELEMKIKENGKRRSVHTKVKILEEIIDTAEKFKIYYAEKEDKELMENIFHIIKNKIRELFVKVNVYLCIEEYMFPSFINNKVFVLRNVIQQFRLLKELVIKIINIITLIISICPYNNERIILENLRKRNIIKKENNKIINHMEKRNDEEKYTNISSFDMIHITNIYDDDKLFVYNKQYENKSLYNNFFIVEKKIPFINFLQEKEKIMLSQFNDFTNYQTKNNHIILFILKKIQRILQYIPQSLKFLKSYISYRLCEINRFGNFYINNSPLITNLLDKTNEFIKSIENFNYIHIHNIIYTKLSYINYHTPYLYKQHMTYINNINQTFNKAKVHTYDKLQKNLKDLQNFKKDNIQLNMKLLKSKKENKKLKTVNQETLNNFRNILLENQELSLNNQYLINSIDNKREDKQYSNDNNNIQTYAEKIYNFISHTDEGKKNFNIKEKQLIEAYISSCIKINNLNLEIQNNKHILEELQNLFNIKENEIKNLNTQIDTYKEEEVNIHKKYEEQMNTLHDLIVSLEKQINKINSEKNVNKFFIMCSICSNKNNIGAILKNRKCIKCNSFIIFMNE